MENNETSPAEKNTETIFDEQEFNMQGYDKHIRQARNACFAAAGILAVSLVISLSVADANIDYLWVDLLIWSLIIGGFIACGFWTKKKPYTAIITALILFAVYIILNAVVDATTLYKGLLFKIIIIVFLIKGIKDAKEAQELKKQLGQ